MRRTLLPHAPVAALALVLASALTACRHAPPPAPARTADEALREVPPSELPAFADDLDYAGLEDAIGRSETWLARLAASDPGRTFAYGRERVPLERVRATLARFRAIVAARPPPAALRETLRREFRAFRSTGDGRGTVLFTGYYLPELRGALARGGPYQVPLHRAPDDLVVVRARDFPQVAEDVIGRVEQGRLVPYPTRADIARGALDGKGAELCFVDSALDAFFLEIQGSGVVRLPDGTARVVTYAGKNGQRYAAVGAELVRRGALRREEVSMQSIRAWLLAHPEEQAAVLATNPSYVFFRFADDAIGALGVPVTPDRTIAADAKVFPKGGLAFLETERPVDASSAVMRPFSRFVLDQDAGGAIRTSGRVDLYLGSGPYAANAAGRMKQPGRLWYLLLR
ncbi:murein transglycosylase A [Anaeromyxobacter dehalogenans]|uniref:peptidoglycan lytic exotransglycosylase n=1 Tax=Anaeromyxobacter dehalogenans (strain 2CP-C) TaxID=290397 RepID=Q2ILZ9_ANADE|nr:MltA domain-containing protein [Anaeromyxobacter dehalogenans]ABC79831.1 Membrane-bound lytic murein transglycosylase [Anaeromyxobacter dehalogenans 2CP-C]